MASTHDSSSPQEKAAGRKRSPLVVIFLTIFIDLVGFGIIIPTLPFIAKEFGASPLQIGLLMSIYSFTQFLFSPFWGGLSDRIGRRPTILISLLGCSASYFVFAFARTLPLLFLARALAGGFGGNISTAHAYIGDVTSREDRSKGMGLIGAAFGLGFVFGPMLGGALGMIGEKLGSLPPLGLSFSALGVAVLCLANFTFAWVALQESLPVELRRKNRTDLNPERPGRFAMIIAQIRRPVAGQLIVVYFLSGLAMAQMESMLIPFMADVYGWGLKFTTYGFAYIGVIMLVTQGYLIRKLMPRYGEAKVLVAGLGLFCLSLFAIAMSWNIAGMTLAMTALAFGNGMMRPPNLGMISLATPADQQGVSMGVTNSLASLGRILGPAIGGVLYDAFTSRAPFASAGIFAALALLLVVTNFSLLPRPQLKGQAK